MKESVFLVAFFRFDDRGQEYGFKRIHLQSIWKTEAEARENMSFCDEAGWYEGALIEERPLGHEWLRVPNRVWLIQQFDGTLKEIEMPTYFCNIGNLIG